MTRAYTQKKRAENQAETRRRIVDAAVALHTSVGPARTSISAIAKEAGVQRHTVYAHFPDEPSLYGACSAHWEKLHPFPDAAAWGAIEDDEDRFERALRDVYGWYASVADDLELFSRDALLVPEVGAVMAGYDREIAGLADRLASGLGRRRDVRAAVGHALAFETWRSLVRREGLTNARAVRAMARFVERV
jgi:AcrR family transcriptional regulator